MSISASMVKELRALTGAGMMECKKALLESAGDIESAQELLRKRGQASAAKKSGRIAAEGCIVVAVDGKSAAIVEVNCETDFVAKDGNFQAFADQVAELVLEKNPADIDALMATEVSAGAAVESVRQSLVAKIGENVNIRRFERIEPVGSVGRYSHGSKIGVLVDIEGGDDDLRKDVAMHIAASSPTCVSSDDVDDAVLAKERNFLSEQAAQEGKPAEIVEKMVAGRMRKFLNDITLLGQPFVKDPDMNIGKLLKQSGATVHRFVRLEVGEGIEKKVENFADEVKAQVDAQG
jgi:elongation factor Ts